MKTPAQTEPAGQEMEKIPGPRGFRGLLDPVTRPDSLHL